MELFTRTNKTVHNKKGWDVQKPVNANLGLKVNPSINSSSVFHGLCFV